MTLRSDHSMVTDLVRVSGFVYIGAFDQGYVVGEKLEGDGVNDGGNGVVDRGIPCHAMIVTPRTPDIL